MSDITPYVIAFEELRMGDVDRVGGKNASLGEMISQLSRAGVRVPGGFATTAQAFRDFLEASDLAGRIATMLKGLDVDDVAKLAQTGREIRDLIVSAPLPARLEAE
ncbi:MAG: phosphoenolpyruvate synthase, partial [Burkholderiales bacterium]|nr:phosphoenolpyruvate synthase [Burkholderiales bacterium]